VAVDLVEENDSGRLDVDQLETVEETHEHGAYSETARKPVGVLSMSPGDNGRLSRTLVAHNDRGGSITEEYRALRTCLLARNEDERFAYIVTSANPGEGKTVTCLNLAMVMAERAEMETIVIDCDLRKRSVAKLMGMKQTPGITEFLLGKVSLEQVIQPTCYPNLSVIAAGEADHDRVGEITTSRDLEDAVIELRKRYDYVIVDSPPINIVADAGMLGRIIGEALLVVQMGKTRKEVVDKAVRLLHAANVNIAGMILTHRKYQNKGYAYYRYGR